MPETGAGDSQKRSVGAYLREARESRGLPLDEAARVTRIGKNYLLAIEGEMYEKLPNPAYIKGFLRVYAGYLGLSGDEVVAMYDSSLASPPSAQASPEPAKVGPQRRRGGKPAGAGRWLVPLVLLVVVAVTAYFVRGREEKAGTGPSLPAQPKAAAVPAPVQPSFSSAIRKPEPVTATAEPRKSEAALPGGEPRAGIILKLKVNQDCWLNITIDGVISQQYDLKAGDLIEWKGEKVFALDLGNAGGIEAEFNGKPLKPFGEPGKTAHVILKSEGG